MNCKFGVCVGRRHLNSIHSLSSRVAIYATLTSLPLCIYVFLFSSLFVYIAFVFFINRSSSPLFLSPSSSLSPPFPASTPSWTYNVSHSFLFKISSLLFPIVRFFILYLFSFLHRHTPHTAQII